MEKTDRTAPMDALRPFTIVEGTWGHKKTKLKNLFKQLNDDDLEFREGGEADLITRLQAKLGRTGVALKLLITAL